MAYLFKNCHPSSIISVSACNTGLLYRIIKGPAHDFCPPKKFRGCCSTLKHPCFNAYAYCRLFFLMTSFIVFFYSCTFQNFHFSTLTLAVIEFCLFKVSYHRRCIYVMWLDWYTDQDVGWCSPGDPDALVSVLHFPHLMVKVRIGGGEADPRSVPRENFTPGACWIHNTVRIWYYATITKIYW